MKSGKRKRAMPQYAEWDAIHLSMKQFRHICKGRVPRFAQEHGDGAIRIAQTKDGKWWGEWKGQTVFWASAWYELPATVGERARKIQKYVDKL